MYGFKSPNSSGTMSSSGEEDDVLRQRNDEMDKLQHELEMTRKEWLAEQQRVSELEEQLIAISEYSLEGEEEEAVPPAKIDRLINSSLSLLHTHSPRQSVPAGSIGAGKQQRGKVDPRGAVHSGGSQVRGGALKLQQTV